MAILSKYMYNPSYFERLCPVLDECLPQFDSRYFIFRVFNNAWPDLESIERVRHISRVLHDFLPADFALAAKQLVMIARALRKSESHDRQHLNIFIPDYIEVYGQEHPEDALNALEEITQLVSAEFAIRPFIIRYPDLSIQFLSRWTISENARIRQLSDKGYRQLKDLLAFKKPAAAEFILC